MPPVPPKKRPLVRYARHTGRIAPEALKGRGTYWNRINRAVDSLPPAQGRRLMRTARDVAQDFKAQKPKAQGTTAKRTTSAKGTTARKPAARKSTTTRSSTAGKKRTR